MGFMIRYHTWIGYDILPFARLLRLLTVRAPSPDRIPLCSAVDVAIAADGATGGVRVEITSSEAFHGILRTQTGHWT